MPIIPSRGALAAVDHLSPSEAAAEDLKSIADGLELIRAQFFTIQEKRHAGVFAMADETSTSRHNDSATSAAPVAASPNALDLTPTKSRIESERSVALDVEMGRLTALMEDVSDRFKNAEEKLRLLDEDVADDQANAQRRSSISSLSSLASFDDAFGMDGIGARNRKPETLKRQHAELAVRWQAVQEDAKALEQELAGDKYLVVFSSLSAQVEEMMDSLDKALAGCHDFVFAFHQKSGQQPGNLSATGSSSYQNELLWEKKEGRLAALQTVKRSFSIKRASYGPACEQMFVSLDKGVKQHSTQNGTISRRFAEVRMRWRSLQGRIARMDKELRRIEAQLTETSSPQARAIVSERSPERLVQKRSSTLAASPPTSYPRRAMARKEPSQLVDEQHDDSLDGEETLQDLSVHSEAHETAHRRRPSSSLGLHYRPPSAQSHRSSVSGVEVQSRIPRLSSSGNQTIDSGRRSSIYGAGGLGGRPSSALSFASTPSKSTPTASRVGLRNIEGGAPTAQHRRGPGEAALRASMQTPEPAIFARVQRLSLFGGGGNAKRSSRPTPSRYNTAVMGSTNATPGAAQGGNNSPQGKPLSASKRQSALWSSNGRTTPLSAAALAKVPHASMSFGGDDGPGDEGYSNIGRPRIVSGTGTSDANSSVGNYRAHRVSVLTYSPSARSGRDTPTFSDSGNASMYGGTRPSSRMQGGGRYAYATQEYRPNINDAIDLEVARVVNDIGVYVERVDPPLPRGVKELNPSSTKLVRYRLGEKVIVCKLLQLHRTVAQDPQGISKANKVLTRVGGGWVSLEQHILTKLGTM